MTAMALLKDAIEAKGMTVAAVAREIKADPESLRRSLVGKRHMRCEEFVPLCVYLGIELEDVMNHFDDVEEDE